MTIQSAVITVKIPLDSLSPMAKTWAENRNAGVQIARGVARICGYRVFSEGESAALAADR